MISSSDPRIVVWLLVSISLSSGLGVFVLLLRRARRNSKNAGPQAGWGQHPGFFVLWPGCWLAVKGQCPVSVQSALGLHNAKACSWLVGLAQEGKVFISPSIRGWTLVTGDGLAEPDEDVDACFRFILDLSRKLGHVQLFSASRLSYHHAWIKAENGRVLRAYAWAGKTIWNQGPETPAERELGMKCRDYADATQGTHLACVDQLDGNVDKVPLLAARWGFDPRWIDHRSISNNEGIVGQLSRYAGTASWHGGQV